MEKRVILTLLEANEAGFPVILRIQENSQSICQVTGLLPLLPCELENSLKGWQSLYRQMASSRFQNQSEPCRIIPEGSPRTNFSYADDLAINLNKWLGVGTQEWQKIRDSLQQYLNINDQIQVIIETADIQLRQLPWSAWDLFNQYYQNAEISLSPTEAQKPNREPLPENQFQVRILAVLGNSEGINTQFDRQALTQLKSFGATIEFLEKPTKQKLLEQLWNEQGWHIFFFAGHSVSLPDKQLGWIEINSEDRLTIDELKNSLRASISRGLQLAIFNSCDGLGLANQLARLHLPQSIVMRELIPDRVAQEFLQHFLTAFSGGKSFYAAVREARKKLEDAWNEQYPGISWLPVICQNPFVNSLNWRDFHNKKATTIIPAFHQLYQDLDQVIQIRFEIADHLTKIVNRLSQVRNDSIRLSFEGNIKDLDIANKNLKSDVFRLLILGDKNRGKTTFLNALIGDNLLPTGMHLSTATFTVVRYGQQGQATIYFNNGQEPEKINIETFKRRYTVPYEKNHQFEFKQELAFPHIDCVVLEYPSSLLEKKIEIIDSPGINETEVLSEITLNYIHQSDAVLFILDALQPCTLTECRYLDNYIKNRGRTVFFLINAWDKVRQSLVNPDDPEQINEAEGKLRLTFQTKLFKYYPVEQQDIYDDRVFEISSLKALRQRLKTSDATLEATGFPEFITALNTYLTQKQAVLELQQVKTLADQVYAHLHQTVERRILLVQQVDRCQRNICLVKPEFERLDDICQQVQKSIREIKDKCTDRIANLYRKYFSSLPQTFDMDITEQLDIKLRDIFKNKNNKETAEKIILHIFEQYLNDKLSDWSLIITEDIKDAHFELYRKLENHIDDYVKVVNRITDKLADQKIQKDNHNITVPSWAIGLLFSDSELEKDKFSFLQTQSDRLEKIEWNYKLKRSKIIGLNLDILHKIHQILINFLPDLTIVKSITYFLSKRFNELDFELRVQQIRQDIINVLKKELMNYIPSLAQEQWQLTHSVIQNYFDEFEQEVNQRIKNDIECYKAELECLINQEKIPNFDLEKELQFLKGLDAEIESEISSMNSIFNQLHSQR
ncbi:MAG: dynamin family protein [Limnoraphis robusta]